MKHTRWSAFALLIYGVIMVLAPPGVASHGEPNETNLGHTSFWLMSALGTQTLEERSETLDTETMKSPTKAFLYSALVPGSGQLYVGVKRGYLQIAAEVGFLAAYFLTHNDAENLRDDYRDQVRAHVVFEGPTKFESWDSIEDFEHATLFDNWHNVYTDNNGDPLERVGEWYWGDRAAFKDQERTEHDSEERVKALELREDANDKFQTARTLLGIVILNHVVSTIDAHIATKSYNKKYGSQATFRKPFDFNLQTTLSPRTVQSQLVLQKRF